MLYVIIRSLAIFLFKILFRLEVFGQENIPLQGGFILASNHTSYLDPPLLGAASRRVLSYMAKEELFQNPLLARLITALNSFAVKSQSADLKSLRRALQELEKGQGLVIFPEGRRTADGQLDEPLGGVGFLAAKADVPIVPAFIEGSFRAFPVHSKFIRPKKIRVYFGQAIYLKDAQLSLQGKGLYQQIAESAMQEINKLKELSELKKK